MRECRKLVIGKGGYPAREFAIRAAAGRGNARLVRQIDRGDHEAVRDRRRAGNRDAPALVRLLKFFAPPGTPRIDEVGIDARVLLFAAG